MDSDNGSRDVQLGLCQNAGCQISFEREEDVGPHQRKCPYKVLVCPNCDAKVLRKNFAKHVGELCEYRLVECGFCREEFLQRELGSHQPECKERHLCPLCLRVFPQDILDDHAATCPGSVEAEIVSTPANDGGVPSDQKARPSKEEQPKDSLNQVKILCDLVSSLNEDNKSLKEKIHSMEEKNLRWQEDVMRTFNAAIKNLEKNFTLLDAAFRGCIRDQKEFNGEMSVRMDAMEAKLNARIEAAAAQPPPREMAARGGGATPSINLNSPDVMTLKDATLLDLKDALCRNLNAATPGQENVVQVSHPMSLQYWKEGEQTEALSETLVGTHRYHCELKYHFQLPYLLVYLSLHPLDGQPLPTEWRGLTCLTDENLTVLCYKPFKIMYEDRRKTRTSEAIEFPKEGALCGEKDVFIDFLLYKSLS